MPIYMDRHDISEGVTAANVAQMHQEDLKIQDNFGCRSLTYWFDDKRKTAFCLVEAPNRDAIKRMHECAHGGVPNSIIEVETGIVESFLGKIEYPSAITDAEPEIIGRSAFRVIMVILVKQGYAGHKNAIFNIIAGYEGKMVKQSSTQFLISFESAPGAVHAAWDILHAFRGERTLKIGLSAGMPVTKKESIFEEVIKLAERMCRVVKGEIIVSPDVRDLCGSDDLISADRDQRISFLNPGDIRFLTRLMDYTESTWNNVDLKVEDFSKQMACSKSQLYRKITLLTGKSPNDFIRDYRLNEARRLLDKKTGNISEIAFETGFSSPSYFSKCFQKKYGQPPSAYLTAKPE